MPTAMVTFNGRITLPAQVRKELGIKTGDNVDFVEVEKGRFAIHVRPGSVPAEEHSIPELDHALGIRALDPAVL